MWCDVGGGLVRVCIFHSQKMHVYLIGNFFKDLRLAHDFAVYEGLSARMCQVQLLAGSDWLFITSWRQSNGISEISMFRKSTLFCWRQRTLVNFLHFHATVQVLEKPVLVPDLVFALSLTRKDIGQQSTIKAFLGNFFSFQCLSTLFFALRDVFFITDRSCHTKGESQLGAPVAEWSL